MARRRIGQEQPAVGGQEPRGSKSLDAIAALVDWTEVDCLLAGTSASTKLDLDHGSALAISTYDRAVSRQHQADVRKRADFRLAAEPPW